MSGPTTATPRTSRCARRFTRRALQLMGLVIGGVALAACYGGTGSVYVGVAGPGPWVGYPYPYPGVPGVTVGHPPYYWDDDADADADSDAQASVVEPATGTSPGPPSDAASPEAALSSTP